MTETHNSPVSGSLYRVAFYASLAMLVIIPAQIAVFAVFPMPKNIPDWFQLFDTNLIVGFFHADFFILLNNILIAVIYLAFYHALKDTNRGLLQLALVLGFIGIAAYISSNKTFELLSLSRLYTGAATEADRAMYLAAGQVMVSSWTGTAFDAYYVLNGITLLIIAVLMFRSERFSKGTAAFGLAAGIFMVIPSTAGTIGLVFSLLSLVPWYVFTIKYAIVFHKMGRTG